MINDYCIFFYIAIALYWGSENLLDPRLVLKEEEKICFPFFLDQILSSLTIVKTYP